MSIVLMFDCGKKLRQIFESYWFKSVLDALNLKGIKLFIYDQNSLLFYIKEKKSNKIIVSKGNFCEIIFDPIFNHSPASILNLIFMKRQARHAILILPEWRVNFERNSGLLPFFPSIFSRAVMRRRYCKNFKNHQKTVLRDSMASKKVQMWLKSEKSKITLFRESEKKNLHNDAVKKMRSCDFFNFFVQYVVHFEFKCLRAKFQLLKSLWKDCVASPKRGLLFKSKRNFFRSPFSLLKNII